MMENVYLQEAFKALDILNEEDFNLTSVNGAEDAKEFLDTDEKSDFIDVIDPEATTEEEIKDSYVGDVILDCKICHSKLYKSPDEVKIDEEAGLANIDEECPFCYSTDGYEIIGMVAPYGEEETEEEVEVEVEPEEEKVEVEETSEVEESLKEDIGQDISEYQKWVDYDMKKYGRISFATMKKIKKAGFSVVKDQYGEYEVIADRKDESCEKKPVKEHFEKVEIETDTEKMEMTSEPDGKTVIVTEPKEVEEEVIEPVSDEVQTEINIKNDEEPEDDFEDIDVDEFSEEEFDELGESYLKKIYENVDSFKTSSIKSADNKLVVEGVIGFNSGKQKKTSFVFESKDVTKKGKVRFIGENLQMSKGKKAFTLTGSINEGKFIAESLNYNYRTKDSEGKSTRLYGTVKVNKQ